LYRHLLRKIGYDNKTADIVNIKISKNSKSNTVLYTALLSNIEFIKCNYYNYTKIWHSFNINSCNKSLNFIFSTSLLFNNSIEILIISELLGNTVHSFFKQDSTYATKTTNPSDINLDIHTTVSLLLYKPWNCPPTQLTTTVARVTQALSGNLSASDTYECLWMLQNATMYVIVWHWLVKFCIGCVF